MKLVLVFAGYGLGLMIGSMNPGDFTFNIGLIIAISTIFPLFILERKEKKIN